MIADLKFAFRQLAKAPGFTAVVVLSLALGIGANTTVLCWIDKILLRPLPAVARQHELAFITTSHGERMWDTVSLPDLRDAAAMTEVFRGVTGSQQTPACLAIDGRLEWLYGQIVTANFFDVLEVKPLLGRTFLPSEDEKPGGHPVLVISEPLWRTHFGGDPHVIGRVVELNRHAFTIVGVAPAAFYGDVTGLRCDFWAPTMMHREVAYSGLDANQILRRYARWHHTLARLQPGVSLDQARAALTALSLRLEQAYPETNRDIRFHLRPLWDATYGAAQIFRPVLGLLLAVSLGVLLIVTANVANLLLARATSRRKEIAIRLAVGAGRGRLIRQLLTESLLLTTLGGALGVLLAYWMVDLFVLFVPKTPLPIGLALEIETPTLLATVGLTLVAGVLCGLVPALRASRPNLNDTLKESGRSSGSGEHHRARQILAVVEVTLAFVLLVGAGLCWKGLKSSRHIDPGLKPDGVLLVGLRVGMNGYTRETAPQFYRVLRERVAGLPGVEAAALANWFPLGFEDTGTSYVELPDQPRRAGEQMNFRLAIVSPHYFDTMGIPLLAGRDFTERDSLDAPRVAIVNETMAQRLWPRQDAIGRTFRINGTETRVIGVAKSGKYRGLNDPPESFFYQPSLQAPWSLDLGLCVRVSGGSPAAMLEAVRNEIHAIDPAVEIWKALPLATYIEAAVVTQKIASSLLALLGTVALVLAAMGVYAVMAYAVAQRTQEFGVRIALGATSADVIADVLRRGLGLALVGIAAGLAGALAVTHLLAGFLYGVSPFDLTVFVGVPLALALTALLACYLPARRATRVNPIVALRAE
ncbi:MAG TPA: ABC transporter permease [Opitutus sp.]|nr:ABC transporter permease [Opitutus sp.]